MKKRLGFLKSNQADVVMRDLTGVQVGVQCNSFCKKLSKYGSFQGGAYYPRLRLIVDFMPNGDACSCS